MAAGVQPYSPTTSEYSFETDTLTPRHKVHTRTSAYSSLQFEFGTPTRMSTFRRADRGRGQVDRTGRGYRGSSRRQLMSSTTSLVGRRHRKLLPISLNRRHNSVIMITIFSRDVPDIRFLLTWYPAVFYTIRFPFQIRPKCWTLTDSATRLLTDFY